MKIGAEELILKPESKRALDIEITLWSILVYVVVFLYALDYVSLPVFVVLFYLSYARFFMGNHDRLHTVTSRRLPRLAESIAEHFRLVVTPWVEPYDSIRRKHMRHHATHRPGKTPVLDTRDDPHSALEMGGFLRVFLSRH